MASNTPSLTAGISTTSQQTDIQITDLAPNNYLTIVWRDLKSGNIYNTLDYASDKELEYINEINGAIDKALENNNITYAGQNRFINLETLAKYASQNIFKSGTQRQIVNAIIGLASGDPSNLKDSTINLFLNAFGNITDRVARELGLTDPHQIFSQITGENCITFLKSLCDRTQDFFDDLTSKITGKQKTATTSKNGNNPKKYVGLLLGLTTSDTESYEISIPRRKVEYGSDYTTHLLPQPFKKDFNVTLTNKIITSDFNRIKEITEIEKVKDKLIEIANSHTTFDIYIRLSSGNMYKRTNVVFSSLSFSKDENSGNGYTASFTVEPITEFETKFFIGKKVQPARTSKGSSKAKSSKAKNKSSIPKKGKTVASGKSLVPYARSNNGKGSQIYYANSEEEIFNIAKKEGRFVMRNLGVKSPNTPKFTLYEPKECVYSTRESRWLLSKDVDQLSYTIGLVTQTNLTYIKKGMRNKYRLYSPTGK